MTMKLLEGARDRGLRNPLVMISLYTLWTILLEPLKRHIPLHMLSIGRHIPLHMSNGTWEVVERPYGCKPVGCKWAFKKKLRPDGTIEKYKARLVAKGYTQK
jgi:hypothetical protein